MCQGGLDAPADAHVAHDGHAAHEHEEEGADDLRQTRLDVVLEEGQLLRLVVVSSIARGHSEELRLGLRRGHSLFLPGASG